MTGETPRRFAARRGLSVSYKGKTLLSTIDPAALADRIVAALPDTKGTLYFCPSPLYGYGLQRLLDRIGPEPAADSAVLCVEIDEALMGLSQDSFGESLLGHPRLRLVRTADPALLCGFVREAWGSRRFRRLTPLGLTGGRHLYPEAYAALEAALAQDIALDWGNAMTLVKLGRLYARNALRNLALLPKAPPVSALSFGADPVLVLGAGPSLDPVLDALTAEPGLGNRGSRPFRIVCVDTALSSLRERNIQPDLAVALESQHWNLRDFIGLGGWELPVAMDLSALPVTGDIRGLQPYLFASPWTRLSLFDRLKAADLLPDTLPPLGSVGLSALALACRLSTGPLIVAGIDFSYTPDRSHARSAPAHLDQLRRQTRLSGLINAAAVFRRGSLPALPKTGAPVLTNPAMKSYRDLFEREFAGQGRIRDIAGSGLPLGLKTLTLGEAFAILTKTVTVTVLTKKVTVTVSDTRAAAFVRGELEALTALRGVLTGEACPAPTEFEALLDYCGYLWAHFPDCAGAEGRRPGGTDIGFLKRVRTEIDPFIKLLELTLRELSAGN
ncbi:conserved hypothetical protein [Treponema primitia ZAS-2]|uniref:6-hydroxymethylpterin diphosphokinase MptE-like domain-containing protein n=1 Tax=Treponema primitia (strain ATCC BAA-887 / DSM 12427 / ZAS-2) TaxID=545694 RepID=F5YJM2_TREPZ|nr:6-hydroxymethylpterin diphosphokinase MptE-like protein [Treponema primitia]AEF85528.1 conserved hypothetical protein [Treponema primitia ZAS-2]